MGKSSLLCPGFRFKPTDVELVMFHLKKKLLGKKIDPEVIKEVNIYDFSPWDLPVKSILSGDREWYFFCSQSKKYSSGSRMNRATETGYWKGSGKDREVKYNGRTVAVIKTLIFHLGHAPKGTRTNWVMHEFRMKDEHLINQGVSQEAYVICKVFEKSGLGPKNGAQYGAPFEEEEWDDDDVEGQECLLNPNSSTSGPSTITCLEKERVTDVHVNDDDDGMLITHGDLDSMLCDNNIKEVKDCKGKNKDDGIDMFQELAAISKLDDLGQDAFDMFGVDDDNLDTFLPDDEIWKLLDD